MTPEARIAAAADILDRIHAGEAAEKALTSWARRSRFAGSGDRAVVRDHVFDALRCRRSFAALGGAETGRGLMMGALLAAGTDPEEVFSGQGHAPAPLTPEEATLARDAAARLARLPADVKADMPLWLWPRLEASLGASLAETCEILRHRAPVFLRMNLRKADLATAIDALSADGIATRPHPLATTALEVTEGARRVGQSAAYRDGLVELQDVASQALAEALPLKAGQRVLDYCAGGGGKTLAMAGLVDARFTAHDAIRARLSDLPARARRAGVDVTLADRPDGPFDLVLCDVPCSGSGSWRRSPEGKWLLTDAALRRLTDTQDRILDEAAPLVAPGGALAYATCSLLREENEDRTRAFLTHRSGWKLEATRRWSPTEGGDGFYLASFRRPD